MTTHTFDLVVLGSGAAGLTAAAIAAAEGLSVLLLEKSRWLGGTTAYSGGAPWVPGNPFMARPAGDDDRQSAKDYLREVLGNRFDEARSGAYVDAAPQMLADLQTRLGIAFVGTPLPDYSPDAAQARVGRTIASPELDGRTLDPALLARIRPPLPQLSLFGNMQVSSADMPSLRAVFRKPKAFAYVTRLLLRYVGDLLRHGRPTRLTNGRALAARLAKAAADQGVTIWTEAETRSLIQEEGAVRGVTVAVDGQVREVRATRGVVLATGGFGADQAMREQFIPMAASGWNVQPESCTGDGLRLGEAVGGHVLSDNGGNALGTPMSARRGRDGALTVFPHFAYDRHFPGAIAVGPDGRRFVNEARDYQRFVAAMHAGGIDRAWLIGDADLRRTYGMGLVRPWPFPDGPYLRDGYLVRADSIAALASKLGLDPTVLAETVARFNAGVAQGVDEDFARGADAYSRFMGDAAHQPNPTLGPLDRAPFYAIELRPGDLSTFAGLETDVDARVLGGDGAPIPGLYAVGLDMNPVARGAYPSGGFGLGPGMTFAWRAAKHAARG